MVHRPVFNVLKEHLKNAKNSLFGLRIIDHLPLDDYSLTLSAHSISISIKLEMR